MELPALRSLAPAAAPQPHGPCQMALVRRELPALPNTPEVQELEVQEVRPRPRCAPSGRGPSLLSLPRSWVECVAQPIANQVGGKHRGEKEKASEDRDPPGLLQPGLTVADDAAPCWSLRGHPGPE